MSLAVGFSLTGNHCVATHRREESGLGALSLVRGVPGSGDCAGSFGMSLSLAHHTLGGGLSVLFMDLVGDSK